MVGKSRKNLKETQEPLMRKDRENNIIIIFILLVFFLKNKTGGFYAQSSFDADSLEIMGYTWKYMEIYI